ncbi:MAG: outer membrane protein assembly factor BamE [Proteobacteria bacterium]|nr:outer membrane protein assembly factor BamE [Pseudomonadota bacterium]
MVRRTSFAGVVLAAGVLVLHPTSAALAGAPDNAELAREVEELRQAVQRLGARVEALERSLAPQEDSEAEPESGDGRERLSREERRAWREVHRGMTKQEVNKLLGFPMGTMDQGNQTVWYYEYPEVGSETVVLSPEGKVTGWQKPPLGPWGR